MTYLTGKKGTGYHWLLDLFRRLKLPILDGMQEALEQANKNRKKKLEKLRRRVKEEEDQVEECTGLGARGEEALG